MCAEKILSLAFAKASKKPQVLLFSATMPREVAATSAKFMTADRVLINTVGTANKTAEGYVENLKEDLAEIIVEFSLRVTHLCIKCHYHERPSIIADVLQVYGGTHGRTMIFTATKSDANELCMNNVLKQVRVFGAAFSCNQFIPISRTPKLCTEMLHRIKFVTSFEVLCLFLIISKA